MDRRIYQPLHPTQFVNQTKKIQKKKIAVPANECFKTQLQQCIQESSSLKLSKHAKQRILERNISVYSHEWKLMEKKVKEAKRMGVNDSLVLMKNAAFIVNAKNETVVTALDRQEATSQIFTNINGTIIIE